MTTITNDLVGERELVNGAVFALRTLSFLATDALEKEARVDVAMGRLSNCILASRCNTETPGDYSNCYGCQYFADRRLIVDGGAK